MRATLDVNNGAGNFDLTYYTSNDGSSWSQLGVVRQGVAPTSLWDGDSKVEMGARCHGLCEVNTADFYYAEVRNGIGGTVVAKMDPSEKTDFDTNWTSSTGEIWTINRAGGNVADMRADLTVSSVYGLPTAGGVAFLSYVDGVATYAFTAASVSSGISYFLELDGFTMPSAAATGSSVVTTYDNAATPLAFDTGTSNSLTLADNTVDVTGVVPRSINFASDTDSMTFLMDPSFAATADRSAAIGLSVGTNANSGYTLNTKATDLTGSGQTIAAISGGTSSCVASGSFTTNRWGYAVTGAVNGGAGSLTKQGDLNSGYYCGYTNGDTASVVQSGPTVTDTLTVTTRRKGDFLTRPQTYTSTMTFTAVPSY